MKIPDFVQKRHTGEAITVVTCYDYTFARLLSTTAIDAILVGDSAAMVEHGYPTTISATLEMLALHTAAVARGASNKLIIADLPFMSYGKSISQTLSSVEILMRAGAHAVKLEGVVGHEAEIRKIIDNGVPVMGHIGLTPQAIHSLGGNRVQGKTDQSAEQIFAQAQQLEGLGCFSIVLECIPEQLATKITHSLTIPTIGIGAGSHTSGQVLVLQDLLGLNQEFRPRFVRNFIDGATLVKSAITDYITEVSRGTFPSMAESYQQPQIKKDEKLKRILSR